jgi:hypothetical protein
MADCGLFPYSTAQRCINIGDSSYTLLVFKHTSRIFPCFIDKHRKLMSKYKHPCLKL